MEPQSRWKACWKVVYFVHGACILCVPVFSASDEFVGLCTISRPWFPQLWNVFNIPVAPVESVLQPCHAAFPLRLSLILCSFVWAFGWWPGAHLSPITFQWWGLMVTVAARGLFLPCCVPVLEHTALLEGMGKVTEPKSSQLHSPSATLMQNANAFIYWVSVWGCLVDFFKNLALFLSY